MSSTLTKPIDHWFGFCVLTLPINHAFPGHLQALPTADPVTADIPEARACRASQIQKHSRRTGQSHVLEKFELEDLKNSAPGKQNPT